jgi:hypothetical protein
MEPPIALEKLQVKRIDDSLPAIETDISIAPRAGRDWDRYSIKYSVDLESEINQTASVWEINVTLSHDLPPNYEEADFLPDFAYPNKPCEVRQEEKTTWEHVKMAGQAQHTQRLAYPVGIPQCWPDHSSHCSDYGGNTAVSQCCEHFSRPGEPKDIQAPWPPCHGSRFQKRSHPSTSKDGELDISKN